MLTFMSCLLCKVKKTRLVHRGLDVTPIGSQWLSAWVKAATAAIVDNVYCLTDNGGQKEPKNCLCTVRKVWVFMKRCFIQITKKKHTLRCELIRST